MWSRNEYRYWQVQVEKRREALAEYMLSEDCMKWNKWNRMTDQDKQALHRDWDSYYAKVKESPSYKGWEQMDKELKKPSKTVFAGSDAITDLAGQASKRLLDANYLKKPSSVNPYSIMRVGDKLREMERDINILEEQLNDYKKVYESKEEDI